MKIYLVPCGAYQPSRLLYDGFPITLIALIVVAMNKDEALGRVLHDMKRKFPEEDGWVHLIGDVDEDSTEELKAIIGEI